MNFKNAVNLFLFIKTCVIVSYLCISFPFQVVKLKYFYISLEENIFQFNLNRISNMSEENRVIALKVVDTCV